MFLSSLATLNFSLALLTGLLAAPLSLVRPLESATARWVMSVLLQAVSPPALLAVVVVLLGGEGGLAGVLRQAAVGWHVCGTYSPLVVWCVWWPAWVAAGVVALGRPGTVKAAAGKVKTT
jgi:glycosylphosphatidylinositol transamidase